MSAPLRVGVIGVGVISKQYFETFPRLSNLRLTAVADLDVERAKAVAAEQGVAALTVPELLASDDVDVVLNLTIPAAHVPVGTDALRAGKHVYAEKPLGLDPAEAAPMLALAEERGLRVGSAPDTVLGTGIQTARRLLDDGAVGAPLSAAVAWSSPGHERWHPAPFFYYQPGGGPLLDMGPYYLTALVTLFGPVERVSGTSRRSPRERSVGTGPNAGAPVPVTTDTSMNAILEHRDGTVSTVSFSFDLWATRRPLFEVYGTEGTIAVPDPNRFDDPVELWTAGTGEWRAAPANAGYPGAARGTGLADMARAIETGRPHRASGDLALHVLEIMAAVTVSSETHTVVELQTTVDRPEAVPEGADPATW
ncbi:MAG TPA: Gfo/Idh/MocA family oxidoreductase [Amnibacterium sp.]|uniref:Gfo/Idh/MocA family protein n=1 Tax=Amnibacterium sp. TaxID=1872496 RepID=UPI002F92B255